MECQFTYLMIDWFSHELLILKKIGRAARLEPLTEGGVLAACPICLLDLDSNGTPDASVQWTLCCGRVFHAECALKLS